MPSKSPDAFQLKFTKPKPVSSVWGKVGTARPLMLLPLLPIMNSFCNFVTKSNIFQMSDEYNISENFDAINDLVKMTQQLGKQAVVAYKPIVDDICSRDASETSNRSAVHIWRNILMKFIFTLWNITSFMSPRSLWGPNMNTYYMR